MKIIIANKKKIIKSPFIKSKAEKLLGS